MICLWLNLISGVANVFAFDLLVNNVIGAMNLLAAGYLYGVRLADAVAGRS